MWHSWPCPPVNTFFRSTVFLNLVHSSYRLSMAWFLISFRALPKQQLFRDAFPLTIKEIYQSTNISTNNKTNSTLCSLKLTISSLTVIIIKSYLYSLAFPGDSVGKNLPTFQCRWYRFNPWLGRSSGEENGTPLSILAWEIAWIEEPDELQSRGLQRVK